MIVKKSYYENGQLEREYYVENGKGHRINGPYYTSYYRNGQVQSEHYQLNGMAHRTDGPASIHYYKNGQIQKQYYYLNDKQLNKKEWLKRIRICKSLNGSLV